MSSYSVPAFKAVVSGSITVAVSATSTAYALASWPANYMWDMKVVRIFNQGANTIHIEWNSSATGIAATSGVAMAVPAGAVEIVGVDNNITHVIALATSGPTLASFTIGAGL